MGPHKLISAMPWNIKWRSLWVSRSKPLPLNIAFVSDTIYPYSKGGREKRLYEVSTRLASQGYEVHIYTMQWWSGPKHVVEQGVHLHAICKNYALYQGDRRAIWPGLRFGLASLKLSWRKFDVVDVDQMPFFPIYSLWLICLLRRKKLYVTWHEVWGRQYWTDYLGWCGNIAALVERISAQLPHSINSISTQTSRLLHTNLRRQANVTTICNGVDLSQIARVRPAKTKFDVLCVSRLLKHKNVDLLLQAIALIKLQRPQVQCTIIGQGPEKVRLQQLVEQLGLVENVTFIAMLERSEDIYAYMKAAKVFALPSEREGFGIVFVEAMACNVPVVTVDANGNAARHLVPASAGSVVAKTVPALAAAIDDWLVSTGPVRIRRFAKPYDWEPIAQQLSQVYAQSN